MEKFDSMLSPVIYSTLGQRCSCLLYTSKEGIMKSMFVSKEHTPLTVPLFAYGPQSKLFGGVQENSDVSNKILQLLAK